MLQFIDFYLIYAEKRCLYADCSRTGVGHICAMRQAYLFRGISSNVKCMHASGHGYIVYCIEFL